jgi:hypothetical protein
MKEPQLSPHGLSATLKRLKADGIWLRGTTEHAMVWDVCRINWTRPWAWMEQPDGDRRGTP